MSMKTENEHECSWSSALRAAMAVLCREAAERIADRPVHVCESELRALYKRAYLLGRNDALMLPGPPDSGAELRSELERLSSEFVDALMREA